MPPKAAVKQTSPEVRIVPISDIAPKLSAAHNFQVAHCRLEVGRNGIIHALAAHNLSRVS